MAKQIIILETLRGTGLGDTTVNFIFWFSIPVARQVPNPGFTSNFRSADPTETLALQNGSVIEEWYSMQVPPGVTGAQVQTILVNRYTARGAEIAALPNVNQFYGRNYDGSVWAG